MLMAVTGLTVPWVVWRLQGADREPPHWLFWVFAGAGVAAVTFLNLTWGVGRRRSRGIFSPYRDVDQGIEAMEAWKWRLRKKGLQEDLEDRRRKDAPPDA